MHGYVAVVVPVFRADHERFILMLTYQDVDKTVQLELDADPSSVCYRHRLIIMQVLDPSQEE